MGFLPQKEHFLNYKNYTTEQEILQDGKNEWKGKKLKTETLAYIYKQIGMLAKSERVDKCGTYLEFAKSQEGIKKLSQANFCKVMLCPMCAWRRSKKIFGQVSKIMDELEKGKYKFIFLTLTIRNCKGEDLKENIDLLMKSFDRMFKRPSMSFIKGWFRGLEITYNEQENTYHPHFHCVLAVKPSYFTSRDYVKQMEWVRIWQECLKVDYEPNVDIRTVKTNAKNIKKTVAEVAKYTVKDSDYLKENNLKLSETLVKTIDEALFKRRLVAFGGRFKELHKELNLDDAEDGNLIDINGDEIREDLDFVIEKYSWFNGVAGRNYYKL